jgi:hypothetical protein
MSFASSAASMIMQRMMHAAQLWVPLMMSKQRHQLPQILYMP